jgi:hypothetical protein
MSWIDLRLTRSRSRASVESTRIYLHLADDWLAPGAAEQPRPSTRRCYPVNHPGQKLYGGRRSAAGGFPTGTG